MSSKSWICVFTNSLNQLWCPPVASLFWKLHWPLWNPSNQSAEFVPSLSLSLILASGVSQGGGISADGVSQCGREGFHSGGQEEFQAVWFYSGVRDCVLCPSHTKFCIDQWMCAMCIIFLKRKIKNPCQI